MNQFQTSLYLIFENVLCGLFFIYKYKYILVEPLFGAIWMCNLTKSKEKSEINTAHCIHGVSKPSKLPCCLTAYVGNNRSTDDITHIRHYLNNQVY